MKLSEKSLFLGITGVIILAILAVFYTFGYQNPGESDLSSGNFPAASFLNKENSKGVVFCGSSDCAGDAKPGEYIDASSQNSIFFEETITFENFFEKSGEVLKNLAPFLNSAPESRKDTESFTFFGYTYLSDKEIFEKIWPASYRDELIDLQNLEIVGGELIAGGGISDGFNFDDSSPSDFATDPVEWYIEPEKRVLKFSSDEDIYLAIDVIFEEALESKMITQEEMSKFDEGALVLKKLIDQEKSNLKKGQLKSSATLPGYQNFYQAKNQPSLVVKEILDGFFYTVFMAKPVDAKWVRSPDCYKDDDPSFKPLGMNTRVFCCNCGIKFVRVGKYCIPIFKDDCGEKMSICGPGCRPGIPLGCLNKICKNYPNAIWDPDTGLCGCDGDNEDFGGSGGGRDNNADNNGDDGGSDNGGSNGGGSNDSVAGSDSEQFQQTDGLLDEEQSQQLARDSKPTQSGAALNDEINGVGYSGTSNPNGPTVMFDNNMTQVEKDAWLQKNQEELAHGTPETVVYVTKENNFKSIGSSLNNNWSPYGGIASEQSFDYPGEDEPFSGIFIRDSYNGVLLDNMPANGFNRYPDYFQNTSLGEMTTMHELAHAKLDQQLSGGFGTDDAFLQERFLEQRNIIDQDSSPVTSYGASSVAEFAADTMAMHNASNGQYQPSDPNTRAVYNSTVDYLKLKGML